MPGQPAVTVYAVTSERVIIVSGMFSRRVSSLGIGSITDVSLTEWAGGGGTITFGSLPLFYGMYGRTGLEFGPQVPCFELEADVRGDEIILAVQKSFSRPPKPMPERTSPYTACNA